MYDAIKAARVSPNSEKKSSHSGAFFVWIFQVLIDLGANIEKPNGYRRRPLHVAARYNSIRVAKVELMVLCMKCSKYL